MEAWVKVDPEQFNPYNRIIDKFNYIEQQGYNMIVNGGYLFMEYFNPSGDSYSTYGGIYIQDGLWHHVACTFFTDEVRLNVDGVLDYNEYIGTQTIQQSTNTLGIGNNWDGSTFLPLRRFIDEVRIWNVVRTEAEIIAFKDKCLNGDETGLVAYWNFDENSGTTSDDLSPTDNTATLNNGATWHSADLPALDCTPDAIPQLQAVGSSIQVFPNPAYQNFISFVADDLFFTDYMLRNLSGEILIPANRITPDQSAISLAGIPSGMFILELTGKENTASVKVVKQ